jgi:hypothetical protein
MFRPFGRKSQKMSEGFCKKLPKAAAFARLKERRKQRLKF